MESSGNNQVMELGDNITVADFSKIHAVLTSRRPLDSPDAVLHALVACGVCVPDGARALPVIALAAGLPWNVWPYPLYDFLRMYAVIKHQGEIDIDKLDNGDRATPVSRIANAMLNAIICNQEDVWSQAPQHVQAFHRQDTSSTISKRELVDRGTQEDKKVTLRSTATFVGKAAVRLRRAVSICDTGSLSSARNHKISSSPSPAPSPLKKKMSAIAQRNNIERDAVSRALANVGPVCGRTNFRVDELRALTQGFGLDSNVFDRFAAEKKKLDVLMSFSNKKLVEDASILSSEGEEDDEEKETIESRTPSLSQSSMQPSLLNRTESQGHFGKLELSVTVGDNAAPQGSITPKHIFQDGGIPSNKRITGKSHRHRPEVDITEFANWLNAACNDTNTPRASERARKRWKFAIDSTRAKLQRARGTWNQLTETIKRLVQSRRASTAAVSVNAANFAPAFAPETILRILDEKCHAFHEKVVAKRFPIVLEHEHPCADQLIDSMRNVRGRDGELMLRQMCSPCIGRSRACDLANKLYHVRLQRRLQSNVGGRETKDNWKTPSRHSSPSHSFRAIPDESSPRLLPGPSLEPTALFPVAGEDVDPCSSQPLDEHLDAPYLPAAELEVAATVPESSEDQKDSSPVAEKYAAEEAAAAEANGDASSAPHFKRWLTTKTPPSQILKAVFSKAANATVNGDALQLKAELGKRGTLFRQMMRLAPKASEDRWREQQRAVGVGSTLGNHAADHRLGETAPGPHSIQDTMAKVPRPLSASAARPASAASNASGSVAVGSLRPKSASLVRGDGVDRPISPVSSAQAQCIEPLMPTPVGPKKLYLRRRTHVLRHVR